MRLSAVVTAAVAGLVVGCGSTPTGNGTETPTATLALVAGGDQTEVAGYLLPDTVVVRLTDGDGVPMPYARIDATVGATLGAAFAAVTAIDGRSRADGTARFTWRLGVALGPQQLTVSSSATATEPLVVAATAVSNPLRSLGGGDHGLCAVDLGGQLGCWSPLASPEHAPRFVPIAGALRFTAVAVYAYRERGGHGCALASDGRIWCFELGDDATIAQFAELSGGYPPLVDLFTGSSDLDHDPPFCGLTADGQAWCWGSNAFGALGDGGLTDRATPAPVATAVRFTTLAVGSYHACGVDAGKRGWCWGRNDAAQAGIVASTLPVVTPVIRTGTLDYETIVPVTVGTTCGLVEGGGGAWCWGDTTDLGAGPVVNSLIEAPNTSFPVYVSHLGGPRAIGRVDGAAVAVGPAGLGAWWGDLSAVVALVRSNEPRSFIQSLGLQALVMPASHGLLCGSTEVATDRWLCGRMASLTGYPTHQPEPTFAGFGMPLP